MINILSYVGMNMQSELCLWTLLGLMRTIFDATLFKVNANLKQVWQMSMPEELSMPVQRVLRTMISSIMLVQCFTVYVYLASYIVLMYPVFLEERPTLVLPWLLLAAIRKLLCELMSLALGLGTCVLLGTAKPPCIRFLVTKIIAIMPAYYMWMLVYSYYHALKVATAFKTFPVVIPPSGRDYGLELAVRRRCTKSLFGEEQLRKKLVAGFYEERPDLPDNIPLRNASHSDSSCEEVPQDRDILRLSIASHRGAADSVPYEDWFGSEIIIPRGDRILEQFIVMLLRIGAYLNKDGAESVKSQMFNSALTATWATRENIEAMPADITDTPPQVGNSNGQTASYLREYPQIFMKKLGSETTQPDRKTSQVKNIPSTSVKSRPRASNEMTTVDIKRIPSDRTITLCHVKSSQISTNNALLPTLTERTQYSKSSDESSNTIISTNEETFDNNVLEDDFDDLMLYKSNFVSTQILLPTQNVTNLISRSIDHTPDKIVLAKIEGSGFVISKDIEQELLKEELESQSNENASATTKAQSSETELGHKVLYNDNIENNETIEVTSRIDSLIEGVSKVPSTEDTLLVARPIVATSTVAPPIEATVMVASQIEANSIVSPKENNQTKEVTSTIDSLKDGISNDPSIEVTSTVASPVVTSIVFSPEKITLKAASIEATSTVASLVKATSIVSSLKEKKQTNKVTSTINSLIDVISNVPSIEVTSTVFSPIEASSIDFPSKEITLEAASLEAKSTVASPVEATSIVSFPKENNQTKEVTSKIDSFIDAISNAPSIEATSTVVVPIEATSIAFSPTGIILEAASIEATSTVSSPIEATSIVSFPKENNQLKEVTSTIDSLIGANSNGPSIEATSTVVSPIEGSSIVFSPEEIILKAASIEATSTVASLVKATSIVSSPKEKNQTKEVTSTIDSLIDVISNAPSIEVTSTVFPTIKASSIGFPSKEIILKAASLEATSTVASPVEATSIVSFPKENNQAKQVTSKIDYFIDAISNAPSIEVTSTVVVPIEATSIAFSPTEIILEAASIEATSTVSFPKEATSIVCSLKANNQIKEVTSTINSLIGANSNDPSIEATSTIIPRIAATSIVFSLEETTSKVASTEDTLMVASPVEDTLIVASPLGATLMVASHIEDTSSVTSPKETTLNDASMKGTLTVASLRDISSTIVSTINATSKVASYIESTLSVASSINATCKVAPRLEQTLTVASSIEQTLTVSSFMEQTLTVASPTEQTITVASPTEQTLTVASPIERTLIFASPIEQTLSVASPIEQTLTAASPREQTLTVASPIQRTLTFASPLEQTLSLASPVEQTLTVASPEQTLTVASPMAQTLTVASPREHTFTVASSIEQTSSVAFPIDQTLTVAPPIEQTLTVASPIEAIATVASSCTSHTNISASESLPIIDNSSEEERKKNRKKEKLNIY